MRRNIVRVGGWTALGILAFGGVPWSSTAKADDKWIQIGKGIFSASDQDPNGPHHASGRLAQVSWAWDNEQGKNVLWAGASHGGLWKSIIDSSGDLHRWVTITDNFPGSHLLGSFAIRKGDSNYIVIGTGAPGWGSGNGIYYTINAGQDGWPASMFCPSGSPCEPAKPERVSRIVADRLDSTGATLIAATSDGIWKSFDFGQTWFSRLSGVDATDVVQDTGDTGDPKSRWYAGVVDKGIYRSTDHGSTWAADTSGIKGSIKRVSLAACASDQQHLYALVVNNASKLNGIYRSADRGSTWEDISSSITNKDVNPDNQGGHASAIACDPADPAHVFFGITKLAETKNATEERPPGKPRPITWKTGLDGGHSDYNFLLFHEDGKHLHIANDGGYYFYDIASGTPNAAGNLLGINALELGEPKTTASYSTLQGGLASSWSRPDVFVAGLQDNGVVRGDISKDPAITHVSKGDGRHVSIMPEDADVMGFADNGSSIRRLSNNGGTTSKPVDFNLTPEKSAPVLIDPTPGITAPRVFTAAQNLGDGSSSGVYWTDVFSNTGAFSPGPSWSLVSETAAPIPGLISNIDITVNHDRYQIAATVAGTPYVYLYHGPRDQLGSLTLSDIGPLNGFVLCGNNADGRINADRSEPKTLYYTTGRAHFIDCTTDGVEFRWAFVSRNAGSDWTDVTGNIASVSGNADLIKLIGNPGDKTQYFLATSKGVFRSNDSGANWHDYSDGLRYHEQVDDIVINVNHVSKPTLYIATHGRGFWRRTID